MDWFYYGYVIIVVAIISVEIRLSFVNWEWFDLYICLYILLIIERWNIIKNSE